jgi:hypothetical protein
MMVLDADGTSYYALSANLQKPYGVAYDSLGQMYIATTDGSVGYLFKVDTAGKISLFAGGMKSTTTAPAQTWCDTTSTGTGTNDLYGSGCPANRIVVKSVHGIVVAPNGDVYFSDDGYNVIWKVDHTTGIGTVFAGTEGSTGSVSNFLEGGVGHGTLWNPYGMAFDKFGNLWVTEKGAGAVDYIPTTGSNAGYITHVVNINSSGLKAPSSPCNNGTSGVASAAQLMNPSSVAFDPSGNLYIGDYGCKGVFELLAHADGTVDKTSTMQVYAGNSATGTTAFQAPNKIKTRGDGVAVDLAGNVYIGDSNSIWFCDAKTNECHYVLGNQSTSSITICSGATNATIGDGCPGTQAKVSGSSYLYSMAFDPWGNLTFADAGSSAGWLIRKLWLGTNGGTMTINQTAKNYPLNSGSLQMLAHFGANDAPATSNAISNDAPDFGLQLGTCTTNSDTTQDCVVNAVAGGSSYLTEPFTLTSLLNSSSTFYMTNNLYPTCQAPTATGLSVDVTSTTANFTLSRGQLGAGCSGIELYPPTPHTPLTYAKASDPSHGTVTCTGADCVYAPNPGYVGSDSFTFTVSDANGYAPITPSNTWKNQDLTPVAVPSMEQQSPLVSNPATVNITVAAGASPSNPAVSLVADITQCSVGNTCNVTLTATVTPGANPASTGLVVTGDMSQCTGGSATQAFTPGAGNTFTYVCSVPTASVATLNPGPVVATDAQSRTSNSSNTVTINVTLQPTNPTVALSVSPAACQLNAACTVTVTATVTPGINPTSTGIAVTGNMSACTGGSTTQALTVGSGSTFTYACTVPTAAATTLSLGPVVATDAQSRTSSSSNTVAVNVFAAPVAQPQNVNVTYNTARIITLSATGTGPMTYAVVAGPSHGGVTISGNQATYTPNSNYSGPDSFTFKANNGFDSDPATISLNVLAQAPVANSQTVSVTYNTANTITLSASGTGTMTYTVVTGPSHGTLSAVNVNQVTYTPNSNYSGPDSFTFKASNGIDSDPATITINVLPTVPVANPQSIAVSYNSATAITLSATGTGALTYTVVTQPSHGQLTGNAPYLTYKPDSTYSGPDSFTFKATDSKSQDSATVTLSLTVGSPDVTWAIASGGSTSQTVTAGRTALFFLQLSGWTGASGTVSFTCSGAPTGSICTVGPNSATLNSTTPIPVTVSVVTAGSNHAAAGPVMPLEPGNGSPMGVAIALSALLASLLFAKKSKMQLRLTGACAALLMVMALSACGNSSASKAATITPSGSYTVTVTATAGSVVKTTTVTLNVQ